MTTEKKLYRSAFNPLLICPERPLPDEVAVIGVPDEQWGEVPMAIVVLKNGEETTADEVMEHCRANLASFKRPRAVVFVDELPRNQMGKVLKKELRKKYGKP